MWDLISLPASLCNVRLVTSSTILSSHRALLFSSLPPISDMVCCCQDTTTIILDPDFSSEEVAVSLATLHKTGNTKPLAGVLGLDGGRWEEVNLKVKVDKVDKLGEVVEVHLQDKVSAERPSELNFNERAGQLFTLSDNSELALSVKGLEKQLFMPLEDSYEKPKDNKTNMMDVSRLGEYYSENTLNSDPEKREKREKFYCEQCNKMLVISDLEKHTKKMHTVKEKRSEKRRQ